MTTGPLDASAARAVRITSSSGASTALPSCRSFQANAQSSSSAAFASLSSPVVEMQKLTPVSAVSAKEKPAITFTARKSLCVRSNSRARASRSRIGVEAVPVPVGGHIRPACFQ